MGDLVGTREAARLAGVGPTAIKRWADEGVLSCIRTAGGHRRFARAELDNLIRSRCALPFAISHTAHVLGELLTAENAYEVASLLLRERSRCGSWYRVADFLGEILVELGRWWADGKVTIVQEHIASQRLTRALTAIVDAIPAAPTGPSGLLACAGSDEHTLGLSLVDLCTREAGIESTWVGRIPGIELAEEVRGGDYRLVAVSASAASDDTTVLRRWLTPVAEACREGRALLVIGGQGAWPEPIDGAIRVQSFEEFHGLLRRIRDPRDRSYE